MEEVQNTFETSSFWTKNEKLLLMLYEWQPETDQKNFVIYKNILFQYPKADLEIIKKDWETIVGKIRAGKAHELSEGDTNYLGACPKGANKSSLRKQPYSDVMAMQRAFALKSSYMTAIMRKHLLGEELVSFANPEELKKKSIEELLQDRFRPYIGLSEKEIAEKLDFPYNPKAKQFIATLTSSLLGVKRTKLDAIEEFAKTNIQFKTVRLEPNGRPEQHMSFENIDFHQWTTETWEESYLRERFMETKFLFVVFEYKETEKENKHRLPYLKGIKLWNMPLATIDSKMKEIWDEVNKILAEGIQIGQQEWGSGFRETNNLPKSNFNGVTHVRPKGRDGSDKVTLPSGERITKQCFWLNREYLSKILKDI